MLTWITTFDIKEWSSEQKWNFMLKMKVLNPEIKINPEVSHPCSLHLLPRSPDTVEYISKKGRSWLEHIDAQADLSNHCSYTA